MISFVIPAHNEALLLAQTLRTLHASAQTTGESFEVIVAADGCTDDTAQIAAEHGARVVEVSLRQIGMVRNAGARAAKGDLLIFIDADTLVDPPTLQRALHMVRNGLVGGGARVSFADPVPFAAHIALATWNCISVLCRWAAGSFIFARRDDFVAVGGFDERFFICEELYLSKALKRRGRFAIVPIPVRTSGRKARLYGWLDVTHLLILHILTAGHVAQRREDLGMWYDGVRERPDTDTAPDPGGRSSRGTSLGD